MMCLKPCQVPTLFLAVCCLAGIQITFLADHYDKTHTNTRVAATFASSGLGYALEMFQNNTHTTHTPTGRMKLGVIPKPSPFPPLASLVAPTSIKPKRKPPRHVKPFSPTKITNDVHWLLDFAIVGFPKTGTTTLMNYLDMTNTTSVFDRERCVSVELEIGKSKELIGDLYQVETHNTRILRGTKCPRDLEETVWQTPQSYLQTYFPKTKLIVGLRHPVLWFESFYNYRIKSSAGSTMLPANQLVGGQCDLFSLQRQGVCTDRSRFHYVLGAMGKTPLTSEKELGLLFDEDGVENEDDGRYSYDEKIVGNSSRVLYGDGVAEGTEFRKKFRNAQMKHHVFLYEIDQLKTETNPKPTSKSHTREDKNVTHDKITLRSNQFRKDLADFLGLQEDLPPMIHVQANDNSPSKPSHGTNPNQQRQETKRMQRQQAARQAHEKRRREQLQHKLINICDDKHQELRSVLMGHARRASRWIRYYFLKSTDVTLSSPEYFEKLLGNWEVDPCLSRFSGGG